MDDKIKAQIQVDKTRAKDNAVEAIEAAISKLEKEGRQPDRWERLHLIGAISALHCGLYPIARADALLSYVEKGDRISDAKLSTDYDEYDLVTIRKAFDITKVEDVLLHPFFLGRS